MLWVIPMAGEWRECEKVYGVDMGLTKKSLCDAGWKIEWIWRHIMIIAKIRPREESLQLSFYKTGCCVWNSGILRTKRVISQTHVWITLTKKKMENWPTKINMRYTRW